MASGNPSVSALDEGHVALGTAWFLVARAIVAAGGKEAIHKQSAGGLYAQAVLGLTEAECIAAKDPARCAPLTLVDAISMLERMPQEVGEKLLTGLMMLAFMDRSISPMEARLVSIVASALDLSSKQAEECCLSARVLADVLAPPGLRDRFRGQSLGKSTAADGGGAS
ncbi:MAG: hypothetical protein O2819_06760 [Planctomycetota bacterium]|nr:hypothetical protein [Planctomycetota bacterium]MDA1106444.1 hypothetical protein [Planctomycetota bacterium]